MSLYITKRYKDNLNNKLLDCSKKTNNDFIIKLKLIAFLIRNFINRTRYKSVKDDKIHVLFYLDGGLGDLIITLNYICSMRLKLDSNILIDIAVSDKFYEEVNLLIEKSELSLVNIKRRSKKLINYDFVADLIRIPVIKYANLDKIAKLSQQFYQYTKMLIDLKKENPTMLNCGQTEEVICRQYTSVQNRSRINQADINNFWGTSSVYKINLTNKEAVLEKFGLKLNKFITVQRGIGLVDRRNENSKVEISTRIWSEKKYVETINLLKERYPDFTIVQLGSSYNSPIPDIDCNLCGKTSFEELLVLLVSSYLHFDCECGMVHLRHFICAKPSIVIFGPTKKEFYGYDENINIGSDICSGCDWLHSEWRTQCLRDKSALYPVCLESLSPNDILKELDLRSL